MTDFAPQGLTIAIYHHDPLLSAGVAAALRSHPELRVLEISEDMDLPNAHIVVADQRRALQLAEAARLSAHGPLKTTKILVLTNSDREIDIRRTIEMGVEGYLLTGGPLSELSTAVFTLASGGRYLCQSAAQRIAYGMSTAPLTRRENDVLRHVVAGEANKAIARHLGIELGTVKSHMATIMSKLGANSRARVVSIAVERGLLGEGAPSSDSSPVRFSPVVREASMVA